MSKTSKTFALILSATLITSLAGCVTPRPKPQICTAIHPSGLEIRSHNGLAIIPINDLAEILIYIEQLERCAGL